jgi:hypothetical protein
MEEVIIRLKEAIEDGDYFYASQLVEELEKRIYIDDKKNTES